MPRLSFSLRDVFWLTLVAGMGVGWWVQARKWATERQSLLMEARYSAALNKPLSVEFIETPLVDVTTYLTDSHGIRIALDEQRLKRAGLTRLSPITFKTKAGESLGDAIKRILGDKAKIIATEDALLITTPD